MAALRSPRKEGRCALGPHRRKWGAKIHHVTREELQTHFHAWAGLNVYAPIPGPEGTRKTPTISCEKCWKQLRKNQLRQSWDQYREKRPDAATENEEELSERQTRSLRRRRRRHLPRTDSAAPSGSPLPSSSPPALPTGVVAPAASAAAAFTSARLPSASVCVPLAGASAAVHAAPAALTHQSGPHRDAAGVAATIRAASFLSPLLFPYAVAAPAAPFCFAASQTAGVGGASLGPNAWTAEPAGGSASLRTSGNFAAPPHATIAATGCTNRLKRNHAFLDISPPEEEGPPICAARDPPSPLCALSAGLASSTPLSANLLEDPAAEGGSASWHFAPLATAHLEGPIMPAAPADGLFDSDLFDSDVFDAGLLDSTTPD